MGVFMKEEVQTNQKQSVTDTKGYLMPGQVAEFIYVEEFKVLGGSPLNFWETPKKPFHVLE